MIQSASAKSTIIRAAFVHLVRASTRTRSDRDSRAKFPTSERSSHGVIDPGRGREGVSRRERAHGAAATAVGVPWSGGRSAPYFSLHRARPATSRGRGVSRRGAIEETSSLVDNLASAAVGSAKPRPRAETCRDSHVFFQIAGTALAQLAGRTTDAAEAASVTPASKEPR